MNGLPASAATAIPSSVAISSSTNATPIVVTTATDHNLSTGDAVYISDHAVNLNANQYWYVTRLTATTFSLDGSTPTAAGGATGRVYDLSLGATKTIPDDGDDLDAASVNVALAALASEIAWLKRQLHVGKAENGVGLFPKGGSFTTLTNASQNIDPLAYDVFLLADPSGSTKTITLTAPAVRAMLSGAEVTLVRPLGIQAFGYNINDSTGATVATMPNSAASWITMHWRRTLGTITGDWKPIRWSNGVVV